MQSFLLINRRQIVNTGELQMQAPPKVLHPLTGNWLIADNCR